MLLRRENGPYSPRSCRWTRDSKGVPLYGGGERPEHPGLVDASGWIIYSTAACPLPYRGQARKAAAMADKHVAPAWQLKAFRCPLCDVHAQQTWEVVYILRAAGWSPFASAMQPPAEGPQAQPIRGCLLAFCAHCKGFSIWLEDRLVWPVTLAGPLPNEDLGEDIVALYNEARAVASQSPRSAAALLRLCTEMLVQRLCKESNVPWTNLNDGIGQLVQQGLSPTIQQSLDTLRVIGNAAVHPGQVDWRMTSKPSKAFSSSSTSSPTTVSPNREQSTELTPTRCLWKNARP